jgi:hypothetical protein
LALIVGLAIAVIAYLAGGVFGMGVGVILFAAVAAGVLRQTAPDPEPAATHDDSLAFRPAIGTDDGRPVSKAGRTAADEPVYETRLEDRVVTVAAVYTESGRAARVATPMRVTRPGVGLRLQETDGRIEPAGDGPTGLRAAARADYLETLRAALSTPDRVGELRVDGRLGVVEHTVEAVPDAETTYRQARAVVAVANAAESAAESVTPVRTDPTDDESDQTVERETHGE